MHVTLSCVIEAKHIQYEPVAALSQVPSADSALSQRTGVVKHTVPGTSHVVDIYTDTEPAEEEVVAWHNTALAVECNCKYLVCLPSAR